MSDYDYYDPDSWMNNPDQFYDDYTTQEPEDDTIELFPHEPYSAIRMLVMATLTAILVASTIFACLATGII